MERRKRGLLKSYAFTWDSANNTFGIDLLVKYKPPKGLKGGHVCEQTLTQNHISADDIGQRLADIIVLFGDQYDEGAFMTYNHKTSYSVPVDVYERPDKSGILIAPYEDFDIWHFDDSVWD